MLGDWHRDAAFEVLFTDPDLETAITQREQQQPERGRDGRVDAREHSGRAIASSTAKMPAAISAASRASVALSPKIDPNRVRAPSSPLPPPDSWRAAITRWPQHQDRLRPSPLGSADVQRVRGGEHSSVHVGD